MSNSNDRRVRKTKALIRRSLTELLREKELSDISVSELTKLSDISRGTFYLHYNNVFDLFEQTENELVEDVGSIVLRHRGDEKWLSEPALLDLFRYVASNADIFAVLLHVKETEFFPKLTLQLKPKSTEDWRALLPGTEEAMFEYCYAFIANGCAALTRKWFDMGMRERPEVIAAFTRGLIDNLLDVVTRGSRSKPPKA
ncbi:MAG: TetR-like C-terminal domain-containing protein [Clostridiaceae bacterium]